MDRISRIAWCGTIDAKNLYRSLHVRQGHNRNRVFGLGDHIYCETTGRSRWRNVAFATTDTYGHLIPGADIAWVDRLDSKITPHQSAPGTHQQASKAEEEMLEVIEKIWLPPRVRTPIC